MSFIAGILGIASLLFFAAAIVGAIRPASFKDKKTGEVPKRKNLFLGGTAASLIALVVAGIVAPDDKGAPKATDAHPSEAASSAATASSESPSTISNKADKSLGMTPEEFRQSFNRMIAKFDRNYQLAEFDIDHGGARDTFKQQFGPNIALVGTVNRTDGSLRSLIVIVGGDDESAWLESIVALTYVAKAANPDIPADENSDAVLKIAGKAIENFKTSQAVERTVGKLDYGANASALVGLMFSITQHEPSRGPKAD